MSRIAGSVNARRLTRKMPLTRSSMISSPKGNWSIAILLFLTPLGSLVIRARDPRIIPFSRDGQVHDDGISPSQHRDSAAGAQVLAGDKRGLRRTEKGDRCSNFGRVSHAADAAPAA